MGKDQYTKLIELIAQNRDVFATKASELGKTELHNHTIETTTETPIRAKRYKYTPQTNEIIENHVQEMEQNDIIEKSMSSYHSNVILVKKNLTTHIALSLTSEN